MRNLLILLYKTHNTVLYLSKGGYGEIFVAQ